MTTHWRSSDGRFRKSTSAEKVTAHVERANARHLDVTQIIPLTGLYAQRGEDGQFRKGTPQERVSAHVENINAKANRGANRAIPGALIWLIVIAGVGAIGWIVHFWL